MCNFIRRDRSTWVSMCFRYSMKIIYRTTSEYTIPVKSITLDVVLLNKLTIITKPRYLTYSHSNIMLYRLLLPATWIFVIIQAVAWCLITTKPARIYWLWPPLGYIPGPELGSSQNQCIIGTTKSFSKDNSMQFRGPREEFDYEMQQNHCVLNWRYLGLASVS